MILGAGRLVARHAEIWRAKYRKIYDAGFGFTLPGTLMFQEGGSSADVGAQKAYEYSGNAYDYFSVWARGLDVVSHEMTHGVTQARRASAASAATPGRSGKTSTPPPPLAMRCAT